MRAQKHDNQKERCNFKFIHFLWVVKPFFVAFSSRARMQNKAKKRDACENKKTYLLDWFLSVQFFNLNHWTVIERKKEFAITKSLKRPNHDESSQIAIETGKNLQHEQKNFKYISQRNYFCVWTMTFKNVPECTKLLKVKEHSSKLVRCFFSCYPVTRRRSLINFKSSLRRVQLQHFKRMQSTVNHFMLVDCFSGCQISTLLYNFKLN